MIDVTPAAGARGASVRAAGRGSKYRAGSGFSAFTKTAPEWGRAPCLLLGQRKFNADQWPASAAHIDIGE
jgi:hypothetical protein